MIRGAFVAFATLLYFLTAPMVSAEQITCHPETARILGREEVEQLGLMPKVGSFAFVVVSARDALRSVKPEIGMAIAVTDCPLIREEAIGAITFHKRSDWPRSCTKNTAVKQCVVLYITASRLRTLDQLGMDWSGRRSVCFLLDSQPIGSTREDDALRELRCMYRVARTVHDDLHVAWLARLMSPSTLIAARVAEARLKK